MAKTSGATITQIVTNVGVLIGLVVVIYEVQQSNLIAKSQLTSDAWVMSHAGSLAVSAEETPVVLAKACFNPGQLEEKDAVVLWAYFDALWLNVNRLQDLRGLGFPTPVEAVAKSTMERIATIPAGRKWYQMERSSMTTKLRALANQVYESTSGEMCAEYLSNLLMRENTPNENDT